jgi:Endonuclease/Exonuclease/phosphatase family
MKQSTPMAAWGLAVALGIVTCPGPRPAHAGPVPVANMVRPIRLMTYNTALMSLTGRVIGTALGWPVDQKITIHSNADSFGGLPYDDRVDVMADRIKQEDPDVVVLNEVWDDAQKKRFVDDLSPTYPAYIRKIVGPVPGANNPFAAPGQGSDIDRIAHFLKSPAGVPAVTILTGFVTPLIPGIQIFSFTLDMQDSGIMLFSKKPFTTFSKNVKQGNGVTVEGSNFGAVWGDNPNEVATLVFDRARGMDELASKAVGLVRIQTAPQTIVDVAFSHTNADEDVSEENADVRAYQMSKVRLMMLHSLTQTQLKTEQLYMVGDLNTPGYTKKYGPLKFNAEWTSLFGPQAPPPFPKNPGIFFACGNGPCTATSGPTFKSSGSFLTDTWGFETSVEDQSKSNYLDNNYYDYVLHNQPSRQCMQHIRIGSEMHDPASDDELSDHLPVHVDFNLVNARCTPALGDPNGPLVVNLDPQTPSMTAEPQDGTQIKFQGSMQWYYIPTRGAYWIRSLDWTTYVAFDVYKDTDLSTPIEPYHGQTDPERGERFVSDRPLFIRVYAAHPDGTPDRTAVGQYSIHIAKCMGTGPMDSLPLTPAVETDPFSWDTFGAPIKKVWFDFLTDQAVGGQFADNRIVNKTYQLSSNVGDDMIDQVYEFLGGNQDNINNYQPVAGSPGSRMPYHDPNAGNAITGYELDLPALAGQPDLQNPGLTKPRQYWYVLSPDANLMPPQSMTTYLTYLTNLQYFHPRYLESVVPYGKNIEGATIDTIFEGGTTTEHCPLDVPGGCHPMILHHGTKDPIPVSPRLAGPFLVDVTPSIWILHVKLFNPTLWWQIGHNQYGTEVVPVSITPETIGISNTDCGPSGKQGLKGSSKCDTMYISDDHEDYAYRLYYNVNHESD